MLQTINNNSGITCTTVPLALQAPPMIYNKLA